jgi:membrane-associated phospholipid phosphatase
LRVLPETIVACAAAFLLAAGSPAVAQTTTAPTPYHVDWTIDLAITAGASALWLVTPLLGPEVIRPVCPCRSSDVHGIDRFPIGRRSRLADQLSNITGGAVSALAVLLDALDVHRSGGPWAGFADDMVVMAEVVAVNGALTQLVKFGVRRPRPNVYDVAASSPEINDPGNYLAFYSGHASTAFAAGMFYATTFALRHPDSGARGVVYGGAAVAAGSVGLLRVLAGEHFPTDVIAGAAVGGALGLVLPLFHRRGTMLVAAPTSSGAALVVTGRL